MTKDTNEKTNPIDENKAKPKNEKHRTRPGMMVLAIAIAIIAFGVAGYRIYSSMYSLPFDPAQVRHDGNQLYLATFGDVGPDAVEVVKSNIERGFPELVEMKLISLPIPDSARKDLGPKTWPPLSADILLETMAEKGKGLGDLLKMIAITEEPLYFEEAGPERDIWGLTDAIGGNFAVVSTTLKRIEIEDEGYEPGTEEYAHNFDLSLGKSALHEFGHLMGLRHCSGYMGCPMEVVSPMKALEERGNAFCPRHMAQLRKLYELWGITAVR
jgi:predicted Zn-dependent protease